MLETKSACVPGRNLSFHKANKYSFSANVREMEHKEKLPHLSIGNKIFQVFLLLDFAFSVSLLRLGLPLLKKVKGELELQVEALPVLPSPAFSTLTICSLQETFPPTDSKFLMPSFQNRSKDPQWLETCTSKADRLSGKPLGCTLSSSAPVFPGKAQKES